MSIRIYNLQYINLLKSLIILLFLSVLQIYCLEKLFKSLSIFNKWMRFVEFSSLLASCEEGNVDEEADHEENEEPTEHGGSTFAVLTFP